MSFDNPTRLRLGMEANFGGKNYRIVGRSVLGENEGGDTYYWNEFNLETQTGESAILVFDESERSSQWRLFTLFDPEYPITAADAASKSVGDRLNLTGHDVRISFRGSSCVYFVEGKAPEGEAVGSTAEYFNAVSGNIMQVVSWTGDEVECYSGLNLSPGLVASAFKMPYGSSLGSSTRPSPFFGGGDDDGNGSLSAPKFVFYAALACVAFFLIFGRSFSCSADREGSAVARISAPPPPLTMGAAGVLLEKHYRVTGHSVVEVADVGSRWERHEYELTDDLGQKLLLAAGGKSGSGDWTLYEPVFPAVAPSPAQAAAKRIGDMIAFDGLSGRVTDILQFTFGQADGDGSTGPVAGSIEYGVCAANEYHTLLARWNAAGMQVYRGTAIPAQKARAAFSGSR
jgi:hypothetical protein